MNSSGPGRDSAPAPCLPSFRTVTRPGPRAAAAPNYYDVRSVDGARDDASLVVGHAVGDGFCEPNGRGAR